METILNKESRAAIELMVADGIIAKDTAERYFPELVESEDEKIRNVVVDFFKRYKEREECGIKTFYGIPTDDIIAWFEKQGEQKLIDKIQIGKKYKCIASPRYSTFMKGCIYQPEDKFLCSLMNFCSDCFEPVEEVELNPAEKVEPKFKVGDWLINPRTSHIIHIKDVLICDNKGIYELENSSMSIKNVEDNFRLWTIQDAKDGDVLASNLERKNGISPFIAVYKNRGLDFFTSYCFIGLDGKFYKGDTGHDIIGIHPATKEQCDLLFQKMKEAGYEWDAEKKELKKIEQKPAWSEKDENILQGIWDEILANKHNAKEYEWKTYDKFLDWLKSLKDRVLSQQKQEWNEEDKKKLSECCSIIKQWQDKQDDYYYEGKFDYADWLKSLRHQKQCDYNPYKEVVESIAEMCEKYKLPTSNLSDFLDNVRVKCKEAKEYDSMFPQKQWKPTEEQMRVLEKVINGQVLFDNQYKSLKEFLEHESLKKLLEQLKAL